MSVLFHMLFFKVVYTNFRIEVLLSVNISVHCSSGRFEQVNLQKKKHNSIALTVGADQNNCYTTSYIHQT